MWHGEYKFLLKGLVGKDFKIRYRNMSLGVFWSLLNPIVMMGVLTFVFTRIFTNSIPHFPLFILCGMVPFNFFALAWGLGTNSVVENAGLIKRVAMPREIVPIGSVIASCIHLIIQVLLLLVFALASGLSVNVHWLWLPLVWALEILFVCGLVMFTASLNVFIRDTRYVVESVNAVLFWLVPVFYDVSVIPEQYRGVYQYNPIAALVLAMRYIVLQAVSPPATLLWKLALISIFSFAFGRFVFARLQPRFYEYL